MTSFASVQFARSETQHGASSFGDGGVVGALERALQDGVGYAEIWNSDLLNAAFQAEFSTGADALRTVKGDFDADGVVDISDIPAFVDALLSTTPQTTATKCAADVNGDAAVNGADIGAFVERLLDG